MNSMDRYPKAYIDFLAEYHGSRDYFECHEIMEEYWKEQAGTRHTGCWLVFIRIAVACYHARRGNWAGARKMMAKAAEEAEPALMAELGMDGEELAARLQAAAVAWSRPRPPAYRDIELPIADPALKEAAQSACLNRGWEWDTPLDRVDADTVNRHLTRDRTRVVEARRLSAERKRLNRQKD
ncbi:DUF309 domain-containing protein [Cohnella sp. CFH 77786]|uniref:DUF309 domain-containing protein n=1 Tax=Cohnella sp. CFH 77786 TaxID=2662265 RepID=UPI001C60DF19|nr:DUF309 domain-containing protein [Cohnella sp. CFH 77786]MBW5446539.1 DUF309 domain-containing protein [Cohnella sp. CFH 77786]